MIAIDFQSGAHGNFLEFVCNVAEGSNGNTFNAAYQECAKDILRQEGW